MQHWSNNGAEKFLAEVDFGIRAMFNHVLTVGPGSPDDKAKKELVKAAAIDGSENVVMLKTENDFAYGMVENSYYLIAPIEKVPAIEVNANQTSSESKIDPSAATAPVHTGVSGKE